MSANLHNEEEGKGATEASLHTRTHLDQEKATLAHDAEGLQAPHSTLSKRPLCFRVK